MDQSPRPAFRSPGSTRRPPARVARTYALPEHEPTPGDATADVATRDQLERGLRRMTPEQRAVIVRNFHAGLSLAEKAEESGVQFGTVGSMVALGEDEPYAPPGGGRPSRRANGMNDRESRFRRAARRVAGRRPVSPPPQRGRSRSQLRAHARSASRQARLPKERRHDSTRHDRGSGQSKLWWLLPPLLALAIGGTVHQRVTAKEPTTKPMPSAKASPTAMTDRCTPPGDRGGSLGPGQYTAWRLPDEPPVTASLTIGDDGRTWGRCGIMMDHTWLRTRPIIDLHARQRLR